MQVYRMKCCCHLDSSANVQPSLFGGDGRAEFTEEAGGAVSRDWGSKG